jgi:serine phosphatase RsbU (regulator of sigma subunit)
MDGLVYGYNYDSSKKLLKKEKQLKVEGVLDHVMINVLENGKVIKTTETNSNGLFYLKIKIGKVYTLQLSKSGYSPILLVIDLVSVPEDVAGKGITFNGAELILNSFQSKSATQENLPFGKLYYNAEKKFIDFEEAKFLSKKQRGSIDNPVSLMKRSVQKNKNNTTIVAPLSLPETEKFVKKEIKKDQKTEPTSEVLSPELPRSNYYDTINKEISELKIKVGNQPENLTEVDISILENKITEARVQLEKDKLNVNTDHDLVIIKEREATLLAIEHELSAAKRLIELQKKEISNQKLLLLLTVGFIFLLSTLLLLIFRFSAQKKKTYLLLKEKNKKITDSINYASRIQESILPSDSEIKKLLPDSFIFFQPRDVVSGDFYWLSNIKGKIIIACVDCTGHGVPGAFMSLIGNTLLNEIVNEKQITDPAIILKKLHIEIVKALHQDSDRTQSKDGMEMSLCVIDREKNEIVFAGAMNPLFVVRNNAVEIIKPDIKGIGGDTYQNKETDYTNQVLAIEKNMSVYMFTDGYMDQFGGLANKKFNIANFKKLLIEIQSREMSRQKEAIEQTIKNWQGSGKQIDDMLVIGIRF